MTGTQFTNIDNGRKAWAWVGGTLSARLLLAFCRKFPHFRGKGTLYRWAAAVCFRGFLPVKAPSGARFSVLASDFIGRQIAFEGNYEPLSLSRAMDIMASGGLFVDVGCNVGLYTIAVGAQPGVQVIAVDASYLALVRLHQNLAQNPSLSVQVVSTALADKEGLERFDLPVDRNLGTMRVSTVREGTMGRSFWASSKRLDTVLAKLASKNVALLKIDVEGFELSVFEGLDFNGSSRPKNIIVECDPEFASARATFDLLCSKDYEAFTVEGEPVSDLAHLPEHNVWFRCRRNLHSKHLSAETSVPSSSIDNRN